MRAFTRLAAKMMLIEFDALAESLLALTGKSIAPTLDRAGNGSAKPSLASFVTIRPYIDRNLAMPYLSAESIAAAFGLSRPGGIAKYNSQGATQPGVPRDHRS